MKPFPVLIDVTLEKFRRHPITIMWCLRPFFWLLVLIFFVIIYGCAGRPVAPGASRSIDSITSGQVPLIRIGLYVNQTSVKLSGTERLKLVDKSSGEVIGISAPGKDWNLLPIGGWINILTSDGLAQGLYLGPIEVIPVEKEGRVKILKKEYRGKIEVISSDKGTLTVVNILDLENYIRGVVPVEIGRLQESQIEALKAQAIAARTYALVNMRRHQKLGFDLYSTVFDQVYQGYSVEWKVADKAIKATRGMIAIYDGRPIDAFYSSTCGGETESIEEAWAVRPLPYLRSIKDRRGRNSEFCRESPVYRWQVEWEWKSLEDILSLSFKNSKKNKSGEFSLVGMEVVKRSSSGRVKELEIRSNFGKVILRGDEIRSALRRPVPGNPPLRSTLFKLKIKQGPSRKQDIIIATGAGYGHGIGLCQMGAIGMSTKGYQYDKILKHYYRNIDIYRAY